MIDYPTFFYLLYFLYYDYSVILENFPKIMCRSKFFLCLFALNLPAEEKGTGNYNTLSPVVITTNGGFKESACTSLSAHQILDYDKALKFSRSTSEALTGVPSVMVQKTALGQSSPYIRGFTGYHNLLLVDGIRLNHAAMRSGPNQYWSTVETYGMGKLEIVRGIHGVTYGEDAIGGVVNIIPEPANFSSIGLHQGGQILGRISSAENSWSAGLHSYISSSDWEVKLSHIARSFGDLEGGRNVGTQFHTGYDSHASKIQLHRKLNKDAQLMLGFQNTFMDNVPRTHKTIHGITWEGLVSGSELWRKFDQGRNLYYGKLNWENQGGLMDAGIISISLHQHIQKRNRMMKRTQGGDYQFFNLDDFGVSARFETEGPWGGTFAYGTEWHRESLQSGGHSFDDNQIKLANFAQGPLAADADYDRFGLYLKHNHETKFGWTVESGVRYSSIQADLRRYYLSNDDVTTPEAPSVQKYQKFIGTLRASTEISDNLLLLSGLSQGFRPPSLYDLTSTDETSIAETPNIKISPEKFLQAEIGLRSFSSPLVWQFFAYHTWIDDMITRSPFTATDGKTKAIKSNGDGFIQGLEVELEYDWSPSWQSNLSFSWMTGEVEQLQADASGPKIKLVDHDNDESTAKIYKRFQISERATSRLMPVQAQFITRYAPLLSSWESKLSILAVGEADDLSLKDETDKSRIPTKGTPSFLVWGLSLAKTLSERTELSLEIENLTDEDYRVHGSGLNGAGRNLVLSISSSF